jgi:hypothetical protein
MCLNIKAVEDLLPQGRHPAASPPAATSKPDHAPRLCTSRGERLDSLREPDQLRIGEPEIDEMAQGAGEIITVGAAATGRDRNNLRSLFQFQPPGIIGVITPYREGKCQRTAASSPHRQSPHIVNPGRRHLARPQGIDRLGHPPGRQAENYAATCAAAVEAKSKSGSGSGSAIVVGIETKAAVIPTQQRWLGPDTGKFTIPHQGAIGEDPYRLGTIAQCRDLGGHRIGTEVGLLLNHLAS